MHRKTITLTQQQDAWVKTQVESGHFGNDSEYIRHLVRQDQQRQHAAGQLLHMLDEAERSGVAETSPDEIWQAALARYRSSC